MEEVIRKIREKAGSQLRTIVLPEFKDPRIIDAAKFVQKEGIARILMLSPERMDSGKKEKYAQDFYNLRKTKGITQQEARDRMGHPLYYAAMMVREGAADGFVAGADHTTPDVARAAIRCLGVDPKLRVASSCFIMILSDKSLGENGIFIFADCGIVPDPDSQQLASIAISAAGLARDVLGIFPRIALLSYSTKGSAGGQRVQKVTEATNIVHQTRPDLLADGELQLDTAIVPQVARFKNADQILTGQANVLIFPNLEAGNIGYKLVQRLSQARAIGPIILGLNYPCSDLSRGCSIEDIIDCIAVTAIRSQQRS